MGKRGPKPKSEQDRELDGNPSNRVTPDREDAHERLAVIPAPPEYLPDGAKQTFTKICVLLHSAGRLTDADIHAIELYADAFDQWVKSLKRRETNAKDGIYRPCDIKACRELSSDINRWSRVLGIGPTYRAGLVGHYGLGGEATNDDVDDPVILGICG